MIAAHFIGMAKMKSRSKIYPSLVIRIGAEGKIQIVFPEMKKRLETCNSWLVLLKIFSWPWLLLALSTDLVIYINKSQLLKFCPPILLTFAGVGSTPIPRLTFSVSSFPLLKI